MGQELCLTTISGMSVAAPSPWERGLGVRPKVLGGEAK